MTICLELLNSKVDHKDTMCDHTVWIVDVCKRVNSPRVKMLYDIYHAQIMEGDVCRTIQENLQWIAHFHTGGVPGRHEIDDTQELNYRLIAKTVADLGFTGYIAHEYRPAAGRDPIGEFETGPGDDGRLVSYSSRRARSAEPNASSVPMAAPANTSLKKCIPSRSRDAATLMAQNNRPTARVG